MTWFTLFDTAIGVSALVWGKAGLVGAQLPEPSRERALALIVRRFPAALEAAAPPEVARAAAGVAALLGGERRDLTDVRIDLSVVPDFNARVYAQARAIPPGETRTYGQIATALGDRLLAREVGAALGKNPWPIIVPCHRVLAAGGKTGGFSAPGGVKTKLRLLTIEGARTVAAPPLFDNLPLASKDP